MNLDAAGKDAPLVSDALLKALESGDPEIAVAAASTLSRAKLDPKLAIPVFLNLLNGANSEYRILGIVKLSECGPAARDAVPALLEAATNRDLYLSLTAISALQAIAPDVLTNLPDANRYELDLRRRHRFKYGL